MDLFGERDLLTWWNFPIAILFSILLIPIGLVVATVEWIHIKKNKIRVGNMYSFWASALRVGFIFGMYLPVMIIWGIYSIVKFPFRKKHR